MKRKRRRGKVEDLGSMESWEFGYLYQGRSWAKNPSPPISQGWALSWAMQAINFPEDKLNELRGLDATVYSLFLRACTRFALLHTFTTAPILLPIHLHFSDNSASPRSMTRASISSLVPTIEGTRLLWIHIILLLYLTLSWISALIWICRGAFHYRQVQIQRVADGRSSATQAQRDSQYHPHLNPRYPFQSLPTLDDDKSNRGLQPRTVMVTNVPLHLRSEKELADYFEYYLSRPSAMPSVALPLRSSFLNKLTTVLYNRARQVLEHRLHLHRSGTPIENDIDGGLASDKKVPVILRVVICRKMTELASLLERREAILQSLEAAHITLARNVLNAVKHELDKRDGYHVSEKRGSSLFKRREYEAMSLDAVEDDEVKERVIRTLRPFVEEFFGLRSGSASENQRYLSDRNRGTVWEALHSLPRAALDGCQPLIQLSSFFRGHTVPEIDYFIAKLNLLTTLITESRARAIGHYAPVSTAFVIFSDPIDARRACRYLASHPDNPINCMVRMAPNFEDLDWTRIMKSMFKAEFIKDWVVNVGIWVFTLSWIFPVSLFVGLISIQNISAYWPSLANYLAHHPWEAQLLESLIPTILVSSLTLLIPLILLLIAKKVHTIVTLSSLQDCIMTRYYKFLIVNVLVFFCIGTAALQSFLVGFAIKEANRNALHILADSFPSAGPFYVGWLIFTTAMHGGVELTLFGLPLIMYPAVRRSITPRKRNVGIQLRTFDYYYWLPNHLLVIHVFFVFAVLNPLVIPFGLVYFAIEQTVVKNQFLHVYAKNYEENGQTILIRIVRYSLDGLMLAQAVFLAYMAVLKREANLVLAAVLISFTALTKIVMTRVCRSKFERDDLDEAMIICGLQDSQPRNVEARPSSSSHDQRINNANVGNGPAKQSRILETWRDFQIFPFNYDTSPPRARHNAQRHPIPFENTDIHCAPARDESPPATEYRVGALAHDAESKKDMPVANSPLVSPRPPHPRWNDESDPDHPYDNPYYIKPIENSLWLPRNPCGLLDLDDTIDLSRALTSTEGSSVLGSWVVGSRYPPSDPQPPPLDRSLIITMPSMSLETPTTVRLRSLNGNEEIVLPPPIASRIRSTKVQAVPPPTRRHSTFGRRGSTYSTPQTTVNIPASAPPGIPFQPERRPYLGPSPRSVSLPIISGRQHSTSRDPELAEIASISHHAQGRVEHLRPAPQQPCGPTAEAVTSTVSPTEALAQEVIVEEQIHAEEHMRQEEEEAKESTRKRPWWMRLFFSRAAE
ncbi:hypothetical protein BC827DRAFT_1162697 [Russula dissimulans]|nr:hypothetical protein BC827DRAFT_1162697 [Russula dissimulans]